MAYYNTCPACGCNLDPGEKCDCEEVKAQKQDELRKMFSVNQSNGQMYFKLVGRVGANETMCVR